MLDELLIDAQRHEQEEPDGTAQRQFIVGHRAGNHDRISDDRPSTSTKHAMPFAQHGEPIGKMVHRIDADQRIERCIVEGKASIGVGDAELNAVCDARASRHR